MSCKTTVPISEQLYGSFYPLVYFLRFFGIFPMKVEKTQSGLFLKWSPWYAFYSYMFGFLIIVSAIYGEISDVLLKGKVTMDILSNTDFLASWVVLAGYCIATFVGIFITGGKFSQVFGFIDCLNQVDHTIESYSNKSDTKKSNLMLILLFTTSAMVYIVTMYAYYPAIGSVIGLIEMIVKRYNPLIMNIYVGLMIECMMRNMAASLKQRFVWLNEILVDKHTKIKGGYAPALKNTLFIKRFQQHSNDTTSIRNSSPITVRKTIDIPELCQAYLKLINAANILNDLFGISILIVVLSVFFGLVRTLYYIILLLQGKRGGLLELTMRLSILSHQVVRTLCITEPLFWCREEMQATGKFLCNLLPENVERSYRKKIDAFAMSICLHELNFSACGLFVIDRFLITTLIESITTYVVILLQAAENDEN